MRDCVPQGYYENCLFFYNISSHIEANRFFPNDKCSFASSRTLVRLLITVTIVLIAWNELFVYELHKLFWKSIECNSGEGIILKYA